MHDKDAIMSASVYDLPYPLEVKGVDRDDVSKEAVSDLANLPEMEGDGREIPKNKFLPKRLEASMMAAICTALFGKFHLA